MLDKNFILNKTEFIAYLKCPFQFYLTKELNKFDKQSPRINYSDYEPFLQDGIKKHLWLQNFYRKYSTDIQNNVYPVLLGKEKNKLWKKNFINFEINRFKREADFWEPVAVELFLEYNNYCGKIDRIDLLNNQGHCRVVEYKSRPSEYDEEELLFYTVLLTKMLPHQDLPNITRVSELGIYYYNTGEFFKARVTDEIIIMFDEYIEAIRKEMLDPNLIKKKNKCDFINTNCLYRAICQRIAIRQQKIVTF
ncbi:MAG: PD-(D/E)XK nuclease family protein [Candidatus Heimdallarchaeota archaeon]